MNRFAIISCALAGALCNPLTNLVANAQSDPNAAYGEATAGDVAPPAQMSAPIAGEANCPSGDPSSCCEGCEASCDCDKCRPRCSVFADLLYLRPGNVDLVYATEIDGTDPTLATPLGPVGIVTPDFEPGFRLGFGWHLDRCASLVATFTHFESRADDRIVANTGVAPTAVLVSNVFHPNAPVVGVNSLESSATYDIDFEFVDLDYRHILLDGCLGELAGSLGARYGRLEQDFSSSQLTGVATGLTTLETEIDYDGFGVRFGLDGEYRRKCGLLIYGRGVANFLAGDFQANYRQTSQFGATSVIANEFDDFRGITILEAELGFGFQSECGGLRATLGYVTNAWFNALTTTEYISRVRAGGYFGDESEPLTFDGLAARVEFRF
jgi:hypothetical protein